MATTMVAGPTMSVGDWAVNFNLPSHTGDAVTLADVVGKPLAVVIYLKDGSPACAAELCGFRDAADAFGAIGVQIIALGVDSPESHREFPQALRLPFPLLHEATDLTAGRRFVMLTFLYGEQEARQREEQRRRSGEAMQK